MTLNIRLSLYHVKYIAIMLFFLNKLIIIFNNQKIIEIKILWYN